MIWLIAFAAAALIELYFFLFQRSALEFSRRQQLDPILARYMLPLWYALVWPAKLAKWVTIWFVFTEYGLLAAVACIGASVVLTSFVPVPHRHFRRAFERRVQDLYVERPEIAAKLQLALLRESD